MESRSLRRSVSCELARKLRIAALLALGSQGLAQEPLPRPDGEEADMRQPVQVYVLLGLSLIHI